ncbi:hypothetical protein L211DRAFT_837687 [Terfezia boudieri ATCC MYA-4762]|uniref:Uncharacterized protein n=1 Tax=Terfezia boudieri ATCC MYA-4762 TaxID=1051890 RepID=A0A3N4LUH7_9PEZI|nr:hypothetical protein L211DRAFT_837687 [Terfezia boudieri ATCC MYA-4762]
MSLSMCSGEVLLRLLLLVMIVEDVSQPGLSSLPSLSQWLLSAGVVADPQVSPGRSYTLPLRQIHRRLSPPLPLFYPSAHSLPHPPLHSGIQSPLHPPAPEQPLQ